MIRPTHPLKIAQLFLLSVICLILAQFPAIATTYTWDITPGIVGVGNGSIEDGSGTWNTSTGNWSTNGGTDNLAWPNNTTDIAEFTGTTGGVITVNAIFSAGGLLFSGVGTNSYTFTGVGAPTLTLGNQGITVNASAGVQTLNNVLGGNDALSLNGGGTLTLGAQNVLTGVNNIGNSSAGNRLNILGRLTSATAYSFNLGRNGFGNNIADISGAGHSGFPTVLISGNSSSFWVGGENSASSSNSLIIRNGAYFRAAGGNGTTNSKMGRNAGSHYNSITVTGNSSTLSHGGHRIYMGESGSFNNLTVSAGGQFLARVLHIGDGGDGNTVTVSDAGSYLSATECTFMSGGSGASYNSLVISNGATMFTKARTTGREERALLLGGSDLANGNSITVTDAGSLLTVGNVVSADFTMSIGLNNTRLGTTSVAASNNTFSILNGAGAILNNSLLIGGIGSAFNLGDGTDLCEASVYSVALLVPDARMNINNGKLVANANAPLIYGPGIVNLEGPAFISTVLPDSSIDSTIAGIGDLVKEGSGTLILSGTNTLDGALTVSNGVLRLTHDAALSTSTDLWIDDGSTVDLDYAGIDTIRSLTINGFLMRPGVYGSGDLPSYITGSGRLRAQEGIDDPGILILVY